ncbi:MAG TPA: hypothetical protein VLL52_12765, partial [Anaerolineae bacterium]|nr:hypothetical protein [Anaerolineae bacterium]
WAERQALLVASLGSKQIVLAQVVSPVSLRQDSEQFGILALQVTNNLAMPVTVLGVDIDGGVYVAVEAGWVESGGLEVNEEGVVLAGREEGARVVEGGGEEVALRVPLTRLVAADDDLAFSGPLAVRVAVQMVGGEVVWVEAPAGPAPLPEQSGGECDGC